MLKITGLSVVVLNGVQLKKVIFEKYSAKYFKKRVTRVGMYISREVVYINTYKFNNTLESWGEITQCKEKQEK